MYLVKNKLGFLYFIFISLTLSSCLSRPERIKTTKASKRVLPINSNAKLLENYAAILGVSSTENLNATLYNYIDEWMGAPHRLGGQTKSGIDCSAFISNIYENVYNKPLQRTSSQMAEQVKRKYENQLIEGDLVFFSFGKHQVDHVGLYLGNNKFVHVSTSKGVMISDLHEPWFYKYFVRAGTVK